MLKTVELYKIYADATIELYFKLRYGHGWRWYYLNWEQNKEFLP
jgi:hypothetical protein